MKTQHSQKFQRAIFGWFLNWVILLSAGSAAAFPEIKNPSFENDGDAPAAPGNMVPSDWICAAETGINPAAVFVEGGGLLDKNGVADNGVVPHGTRVLWMQSLPTEDVEAFIYQDIEKFEQGKTYVLVYWENVRAGWGAPLLLWVTLGDSLIDPSHRVYASDGMNQHQRPYTRRISREFTAPSAGPHRLTFTLESSVRPNAVITPGVNYPDQVQERRRGEGDLLLDHLYFIELSPEFKLLTARRSYNQLTRITAKFNRPISRDSAEDLRNYLLNNTPNAFIAATLESDAQTVTLTSLHPLENDFGPYRLSVSGILDTNNFGMFSTNSSVEIDISPILPSEFTNSILKGYQDDFNGAARSTDWVFQGPAGDVYKQRYGVLKVESAAGQYNHLLYKPSVAYNGSNQEILAKVRIGHFDPVLGRGGIAVAVAPTVGGVDWVFAPAGKALFDNNGRGVSPDVSVNWKPAQWHWVRLKHAVSASRPAVSGKIWLADFDTPEPEGWHSFEYPGQTRSGWAGIAAGIQGISSEFDVDYILIKASDLPEITPEIPLPAQLPLELIRQETSFNVRWPMEGSQGYELQISNDISSVWNWQSSGLSPTPNGEYWEVDYPSDSPDTFFRLMRF